eukprot:TRINITY_DN1353_c0_g1_i1.p1 TRINITY_DN1353_c0_g1~~TRINITY_DN1353_c0_g1_i1.p1  ORF type:complete len:504 (+),score=178.75 TRINITY_DN1353_c0_g1_i1:2-1513(+)
MESNLTKLIKESKKISTLRSITSVLTWDQQVMLPPNGSQSRGQQLQVLSGIAHDLETSQLMGELISNAEKENVSDPFEKALIRLARKSFDKASKIPKELVEESAKLENDGFEVWAKARKEDKFEEFSPILRKWVDLKKRVANHIDPNKPVLDVLIDEHDPEMKSERLDELFNEVKNFLIPFIQKIKNAKEKTKHDNSFLFSKEDKFDIESQEKLSRKVAKDIGFNLDCGRIDVSTHPMTIGIDKDDVRITTRYKKNDFYQGLAGTVHECGHAMYEQGINEKYKGTPVAQPQGMSLHESQSLLWERHVGLSEAFWQHYWPITKSFFDFIPNNVTNEQAYLGVNAVDPIFIRVESDEVTYPMHVILRYEIEKGLFNGTVDVDKLPEVWNQKFNDYLGITPPNNTQGVLQDIHWALGAFGYFPSYLVGAMLSAQIYHQATISVTNLNQNIKEGRFTELRTWLNQNIHEKGSLMSFDELMVEVTGEKLNPKYFFDYLTKKYSQIYQL